MEFTTTTAKNTHLVLEIMWRMNGECRRDRERQRTEALMECNMFCVCVYSFPYLFFFSFPSAYTHNPCVRFRKQAWRRVSSTSTKIKMNSICHWKQEKHLHMIRHRLRVQPYTHHLTLFRFYIFVLWHSHIPFSISVKLIRFYSLVRLSNAAKTTEKHFSFP